MSQNAPNCEFGQQGEVSKEPRVERFYIKVICVVSVMHMIDLPLLE